MPIGEHIQVTSAYTLEFLALATALKLQTLLPIAVNSPMGLAPVRSDANSIVSILKHRRKKLRQASKSHHLLLQCIDNCIYKGCKLPMHVKGRVEKRKPGKKTHGHILSGATTQQIVQQMQIIKLYVVKVYRCTQ